MMMVNGSLAVTPNGDLLSDDRDTDTFSGLVGSYYTKFVFPPNSFTSIYRDTSVPPLFPVKSGSIEINPSFIYIHKTFSYHVKVYREAIASLNCLRTLTGKRILSSYSIRLHSSMKTNMSKGFKWIVIKSRISQSPLSQGHHMMEHGQWLWGWILHTRE